MTPEEIARLPFRGFWEKGYQDRGVSTMGGPNHDIVELAAALTDRGARPRPRMW